MIKLRYENKYELSVQRRVAQTFSKLFYEVHLMRIKARET